jgi:hypothetical protein
MGVTLTKLTEPPFVSFVSSAPKGFLKNSRGVCVDWLAALERAERREQQVVTTHNTPPSKRHAEDNWKPTGDEPAKPLKNEGDSRKVGGYQTDKTDKWVSETQKADRCRTDKTDKRTDELAARRSEKASKVGLIARWSYEFGYVSLHDPTTGEWHDVAIEEAPKWAKREAFKRKELRKLHSINRLLTQIEMEEVWKEGMMTPQEKETPPARKAGLVYDEAVEEE